MNNKRKEKPENQWILWMIIFSYIENQNADILVILGILDQGAL